jgi:hypothetical protein
MDGVPDGGVKTLISGEPGFDRLGKASPQLEGVRAGTGGASQASSDEQSPQDSISKFRRNQEGKETPSTCPSDT